jgi:hypothetical protein
LKGLFGVIGIVSTLPICPPQSSQRNQQAPVLSPALASLTVPPAAPDFVSRALRMLESIGWIAAHRFLFSQLRAHLLGWPVFKMAPARPAS